MNNTTAVRFGRYQRIFFLSLVIVLAAQLNINLFVTNFKISIAVIFFAIFVFLLPDIPLLPITFLAGIGVYLSRVLYYWFQNGTFDHAWRSNFPEWIFYISYGLLLYLYVRYHRRRIDKRSILIPLFFIDYLANFLELFLRLRFQSLEVKAQVSILLVALLRTLLVGVLLVVLDKYKFSLLKREHAERYQRLMLLISRLNGEVLWMKKNTSLMEQTMHSAYELYGQLKMREEDAELAQMALHTAKDIHEIKKEYLLILRGLSEALDINLKDEGMAVLELLLLLKNSLAPAVAESGQALVLDIKCSSKLYTEKHYFLLSVFRNLFANAIEACEKPEIFITVRQVQNEDGYLFTVTDSGLGIDASFISQVFNPGFSTKINYTTGEINRGLGLNLVKDIIENQFHGKIWVESQTGKTTFYIQLPTCELEVLQQL